MKAEDLYHKEFGNADSIPKESAIRLLKHFAVVLQNEREKIQNISAACEKEIQQAADLWVFKENGHKWSNNDNTAGDNFGSFMQGAKFVLNFIKKNSPS